MEILSYKLLVMPHSVFLPAPQLPNTPLVPAPGATGYFPPNSVGGAAQLFMQKR